MTVAYAQQGTIAVLTVDNPPVNALSVAVRQGLIEGIKRAVADPVAFAERLVADKTPIRRLSQGKIALDGVDWRALLANARGGAAKSNRGQISPQRVIDCVENALTLPFDQALGETIRIINELIPSDQAKALRYAFFAEREAGQIPDIDSTIKPRPLRNAIVIGAGTMGGGIAMCFADAGIKVRILENSAEALDKGLARVEQNYQDMVQKGRIRAEDKVTRMGLITTATGYDAIGDADIVIEAAFEEMAIKKEIFARLDKVCKADAILATNTSTLDADDIPGPTTRPESVIGLHFFSPANVMRLLEIVRGAKTSKDIVATAQALAKTIGKVGAVCGVCHGFVANRSRGHLTREASFLVDEGALPQQVDKVLYDFGMAMGPFAVG